MDKQRKGAALGYSTTDKAPRIIAAARGILVEKLLEIAERYNITIYKDADLAEALTGLDVGTEIPEELFRAVAEVLAYCYRTNSEFKDKMTQPGN